MKLIISTLLIILSVSNANGEAWLIDHDNNKVGDITSGTSEKDLVTLYGKENVSVHKIHMYEDVFIEGTVIFSNTPSKRAYITWKDVKNKKDPEEFIVSDSPTVWKSAYGFSADASLKEVIKTNGNHFIIIGYDVDGKGYVKTWEYGKLEGTRYKIRFKLPSYHSFSKKEKQIISKEYPYLISTEMKTMQQSNLKIEEIRYLYEFE